MAPFSLQLDWLYFLSQVALLCGMSSGLSLPLRFERSIIEPQTILEELKPQLSYNANVMIDGYGDFDAATKRWQEFARPNFVAVVEVADENDVVKTISYANQKNISFHAVSTGHGSIKSLSEMREGIMISMRKINHVNVNGNSARIGGGAVTGHVTNELWKAKKQTVTGACECTGLIGPMLGGGHGFLQGRFGLAADQLKSARLVLGNGTAITVSSTQHTDLFWGLRGAGHNFGVVTEVEYKVYHVPDTETWYTETWIYHADSIEKLFGQVNKMIKSSPAILMNYAMYLRLPAIDPVNAVVLFSILFNGPETEAQKWVAPYRRLNPLSTEIRTVRYQDLPSTTLMTQADEICQREGLNRIKYGIYLDDFNIGSQRQVYNLYNSTTGLQPALNRSLMLFEGFPVQAPKTVPIWSTAKAVRYSPFVVSPVVTYVPDSSMDNAASEFGNNIRRILQAGTATPGKFSTYVNYAVGDESLQNIYGHEKWRLDRLRGLKQEYDPQNNFRFYAPIL